MLYQLVTYDVWGSGSERWVNAAYTTSTYIDVSESTPDRTINRRLGARGVTWDGEHGYTLYGTNKRNGAPACELRACPLEYYINIDERGEFRADVRNATGDTIFTTEGFDIFEDGYMKDKNDLSGLLDYLRELGIAENDATLVRGN